MTCLARQFLTTITVISFLLLTLLILLSCNIQVDLFFFLSLYFLDHEVLCTTSQRFVSTSFTTIASKFSPLSFNLATFAGAFALSVRNDNSRSLLPRVTIVFHALISSLFGQFGEGTKTFLQFFLLLFSFIYAHVSYSLTLPPFFLLLLFILLIQVFRYIHKHD